jgi:hypothetical protein
VALGLSLASGAPGGRGLFGAEGDTVAPRPGPGCVASEVEVSPACRVYRRRVPEAGVLQRVVAEHLQTFLARAQADEGRRALPRFVVRELVRFLDCGVLAHGFARFFCPSCGKDALVAYSCKGRGFCPSCGGRRMADLAAHLVDRVFPDVPVRQWVLSLPFERDPALTRAVRGVFLRTLLRWLERRAAPAGTRRARSGAVNFVQRFGKVRTDCRDAHSHGLVDGDDHARGASLVRGDRVRASQMRLRRRLGGARGRRPPHHPGVVDGP